MTREEIIQQLVKRDGATCAICGTSIDRSAQRGRWALQIDHLRSRAQGGTDDLENLRLAHTYCNQVKNRWPMNSYIQDRIDMTVREAIVDRVAAKRKDPAFQAELRELMQRNAKALERLSK